MEDIYKAYDGDEFQRILLDKKVKSISFYARRKEQFITKSYIRELKSYNLDPYGVMQGHWEDRNRPVIGFYPTPFTAIYYHLPYYDCWFEKPKLAYNKQHFLGDLKV